ncbi:MAG: glycosyltransferase [Pyrinomonadaceae bacterium]|nr:glycosyltransferase [Pyrinomonadaceae bacterium]
MNLPKVSVIIPNYNYANYIAKTIDSVLAQTYKNLEIIVIDDGSKDNSLEILEGYGEKIKVLKQQNQGVSMARNNGAANSSGEYIAFLDADDIWLPGKMEVQMKRFFDDGEIGLVHCSMDFIDPNGKPCGENYNGMEGRVADEFLRFEKGVVVGAGSTGVVPRRIFDELGGFDKRFSTAADWDFSYRLATKYKIAFVREPLVLYRIHNSNMHGNIKVMEHDMMLGFEKAFAGETGADRRECYGNLHKTLAGSYFHAKQYSQFMRHAVKSLINKPSNLAYFAAFPLRRLQKK